MLDAAVLEVRADAMASVKVAKSFVGREQLYSSISIYLFLRCAFSPRLYSFVLSPEDLASIV